MAHLHAHERDLEKTAQSVALVLLQHPDWKANALALRDRLDALVDQKIAASNQERIQESE